MLGQRGCLQTINSFIVISVGWGSLGSIVWGGGLAQWDCVHVILVIPECIWNAPAISVVLPAFGDTLLGFSSATGGLSPWFPPWVTVSHFHVGKREVELKPTTFSSVLLFRVF